VARDPQLRGSRAQARALHALATERIAQYLGVIAARAVPHVTQLARCRELM